MAMSILFICNRLDVEGTTPIWVNIYMVESYVESKVESRVEYKVESNVESKVESVVRNSN